MRLFAARRPAFACALLGVTLLVSCSDELPPAGALGTNPVGDSSCATPNLNCPCPSSAATAECSVVEKKTDDYVMCAHGKRTCNADLRWGDCVLDGVEHQAIGGGAEGLRLKALGSSTICTANPCDPYCNTFVDTPAGIDAGADAGFNFTDAGLSLAITGTPCTSITITPTSSTVTVTSLSGTATTDFVATLLPAGCAGTSSIKWTIDPTKLDRGFITTPNADQGVTGRLNIARALPGAVIVTANFAGAGGVPLQARATANVNVDISDVTAAPVGYGVAQFPTTTGAAEDATLTFLYPYANTVFPLGLQPPIPMWRTNPATPHASAASISLRSSVTGVDHAGATVTSAFRWRGIIPETNPLTIVATTPAISLGADKRYPNIPAAAWAAFEKASRGRPAEIALQRNFSGTLRQEKVLPIQFANGQLKGKVYYQSYGTRLTFNFSGSAQTHASPQNTTAVFPSGKFGAATLGIVPGAAAPTVVAGATACRVCHTASASGNVLVSQVYGSPSNRTTSSFDITTASPAEVSTGVTTGQFAWPAISPDGTLVFSSAGPGTAFSNVPSPGGLDGSDGGGNTNRLFRLIGGSGDAAARQLAATYLASNGVSYALSDAKWALKAALPNFSAAGGMLAMSHYGGRACNGVGCPASGDEVLDGDRRSIAAMNFDATTKQFSGFRRLTTQARTPCVPSGYGNPVYPCTDVWATVMPKGNLAQEPGVVFERETTSNANIGGGLSDYAGTRSGCDSNNAKCNNDGVKGRLAWVNTVGAPTVTYLDNANGGVPGAPTIPVTLTPPALPLNTATYCVAGGFLCSSDADCCSGSCAAAASGTTELKRCTSNGKKYTGSSCTAASDCFSGACIVVSGANKACGCTYDASAPGGAALPGECASATPSCSNANKCSGLSATNSGAYVPVAQGYAPEHTSQTEPLLNYEPTMNPVPTLDANGNPEFYWVVFTSRRMFGNIATINPWWSDPRRRDISEVVTPKKLWVAAISANPTAGTDPSKPAFFLPGQEWISGNSKAYWTQDACKATNSVRSAANECDSDLDCCSSDINSGGIGTAVCSIETAGVPAAPTGKSHCVPKPTCKSSSQSCSTTADCCGGLNCVAGFCVPQVGAYTTAIFTRQFNAQCAKGTRPLWRFFEWQATVPSGTSISFSARTSDDPAALSTATPVVSAGSATTDSVGWASGATTVDEALKAAGSVSKNHLRITMQLNPSAGGGSTPTLATWRMNYSCLPSD